MTAFLDLFSGIGGFALGAYLAGLRFDRHYFSETNGYAAKVYKNHFPEAENLGDIRNADYSKLPKGEYLVTAGFPCQPHSDAGLKKGADDERDLWPECRRMLRELRPRIALFENVRGLLTSPRRGRKGEFFNGILSDVHACGYDAEWQVISAADAGAPHLRKRVWIVCYSSGGGFCREPRRGSGAEPSDGHLQLETRPVAYADDARDRAYGNGIDRDRQEKNEGREKQPQPQPRGLRSNVSDTTEQVLPERTGGEGGEGRQAEKPQRLRETLADSQKQYRPVERRETPLAGRGGETLAYSESERRGDGNDGADKRQADRKINALAGAGIPCGEKTLADTDNAAPARQREHGGEIYAGTETEIFGECGSGEWWSAEPDVGRVAHGIPFRVDRIKCLGNAVVPQCAETILRLRAFDFWRLPA